MTTNTEYLRIGETITIRHDLGLETGTILGFTNPEFCRRIGQPILIQVQFSDGTNSSWPETTVVR